MFKYCNKLLYISLSSMMVTLSVAYGNPTPVQTLLDKTINTQNEANHHYLYTWTPPKKTSLPSPSPSKSFNLANVEVLLGPDIYDETNKQKAEAVIRSFSGDIHPLSTFNFTSFVNADDQTRELGSKTHYLSLLRMYTAIQSLGLSNLYQIYTARLPDEKKKSAIQQATAKANAPLTDPNWLKNIDKMGPEALQREMIKLTAHQLTETHEMRMTLERLLATHSVSLLQANILLRDVLLKQQNKATT